MSYIPFINKTIKEAGALILRKSHTSYKVEEKAKNDLVTEVDKASEILITKAIKKAFPSHAVLGEEDNFKNGISDEIREAEYIWIVDPLDGTMNFVKDLPFYAVSIALFKKSGQAESKNFEYLEGEIIAGAVYIPRLDELFYAEKGKGAYLNGKKIHVSNVKTVGKSVLATGFHLKGALQNLPYFEKIVGNCRAIRRFGASAIDLVYAAAGRFDGYWEFNIKAWDIAAGVLIVEEAGGRITDLNGNLLDLFGKQVLVSNGKIHKELVKIFGRVK
ncbi:MAG: inositol monophosphatase family protein [Candidatus Gracilibacteria bacterium]|jgi:myo-inositol-1(or 4)-monophosphatase